MNSNCSINPKSLDEFIGKPEIVKTLKVALKAFEKSNKNLDHILLYGPAGVGKTSLSMLLATEMKVNIKIIQGPNVKNVSDILGILSSLKPKDILFIDEIHSLKREVSEILYPALENKVIDLIIGKTLNKRSIRVPLPDFTLIAATTNLGSITNALEDRFGYVFFLEEYSNEELTKIAKNMSLKLNLEIEEETLQKIVSSSRGIPRNVMRILKRLNDYKVAGEKERIEKIISECGFFYKGLRPIDIKYLKALKKNDYISLTSISYGINMDQQTIVNKIEPYLYAQDLISKSNKGRSLTKKGKKAIEEILNAIH